MAVIWAGIAGATALIMTGGPAPPPHPDVLACLGVALLGVALHFWQDRASYERVARRPPAELPALPPYALRFTGRWPVAKSRLVAALTIFSLILPFVVSLQWGLLIAAEETARAAGSADYAGALGEGGFFLVAGVIWTLGYWRVAAKESTYLTDKVGEAAASGYARVLRVTLNGWSSGVHRPHPMGAMPVAEIAARKGRPLSPRAAKTRLPKHQSALRLAVPGLGERALFLDHQVHAEGLATALNHSQAWLYWVPSGAPAERSWSTPAVLVLGDGRYVPGWTQDAPDHLVPDGPELRTVQTSPVPAELRPMEPVVLRRRPLVRLPLVAHALALALVVSVFTGRLWADDSTGPSTALSAAVVLALTGLVLRAGARAVELRRIVRAHSSTVPAPPGPPPPAPRMRNPQP